MVQGYGIIVLACSSISPLPGGKSLAARWLREPQLRPLISQYYWGFYTLRGGIDPG